MLSPSRAPADARFLGWLERQDADGQLYLSAVTVHEIERGIGLLEHRGATAKAVELRRWLAGLAATYDDKILAVTAAVAARSGALEAAAVAQGHAPGMSDALIAGTALTHGLTIVTQNLRHFRMFAVEVRGVEDVEERAGSTARPNAVRRAD